MRTQSGYFPLVSCGRVAWILAALLVPLAGLDGQTNQFYVTE